MMDSGFVVLYFQYLILSPFHSQVFNVIDIEIIFILYYLFSAWNYRNTVNKRNGGMVIKPCVDGFHCAIR